MKLPKLKGLRKAMLLVSFVLCIIGAVTSTVGAAHCTFSETIQDWLPSIIELSMFGMFMGIIAKVMNKVSGK